MQIFRFLTGVEDSTFCHKVTKALSEGWKLHGSPTLCFDPVKQIMIAGQAVTREAPDQPYDPDRRLTDY